jgi:hypothetical protein
MPDRDRLSRELRDAELPAQATEELEEARTVRRGPPRAGPCRWFGRAARH